MALSAAVGDTSAADQQLKSKNIGKLSDIVISEEQDIYFSELLGYPIDRLSREPDLLKAEQEQLSRQIQETSVANYRSFITTAQCLEGLQQQLGEMAATLDALDGDLPKLQAAADAFRRDGASMNARREANKQLYASHSTLIDILEIPALMETCVRSGNYDEALDLRAYTNKLGVVHGDLPIVKRLLQDASKASSAMLEQLLSRLSSSIQLPECLRVIGYLRRLALFSESALRLHFLQRRESWIASMTADLDDRSAYEFLKRLTDVYRLHVFDVTMQYRAIFSDAQQHDGGILNSWAEKRISVYLDAIKDNVCGISDGGGLASVLDHVMYCGASLGRVGLDFRPLIAPVFETAALELFISGLDVSNEALSKMLSSHKWVAMPSAAGRAAKLAAHQEQQEGQQQEEGEKNVINDANEDNEQHEGKDGTPQHGGLAGSPPPSLVEYPPLAVYTNGILAALNELRHCAPLPICEQAAQALQASLIAASEAMAHVKAIKTLSDTERPIYKAACNALTSSLCPYIAACFERVYAGGSGLLDLKSVGIPLL